MVHFDCDYMCGALPEVMQALLRTNMEATPGYGHDPYCENAKRLIREAVGQPEAEVFFTVGGTQTNALVIDALLRPQQAVVAVESGHINVHESGAIEATGHKVVALAGKDGKLFAENLANYMKAFYQDETWPHMPIPGMVYISFPTELGTIYSLQELEAIAEVCHSNGLPLFIDGARLGYGLAALGGDVTLRDIARLADVFYIGGTKQGLLFGEAIVARKGLLPQFFTLMKQHGAVLAKGRLLGVQFEQLFTNNLYERVSRKAVEMAMQLREGFISLGYQPIVDSPTNQQFFTLPNEVIERLRRVATFDYWGAPGVEESSVRFVTSWATEPADVAALF